VKRRNQEVNNELIKSNVRFQKALQDSEKTQRDLQQQIRQLNEKMKEKDSELAMCLVQRDNAMVTNQFFFSKTKKSGNLI
jgi:hypothetical protein